MRQRIISIVLILIGLMITTASLVMLTCYLEWRPDWLATGAGILLLGILFLVWPRRRMPWHWGWWRLLLGEYTCDMHLCVTREGIGSINDLRMNHMRTASINPRSDKHLTIQGRQYPVSTKAPVEIRRCGRQHHRDLPRTGNTLLITQLGDTVTIKFEGNDPPIVSQQLGYRILAQVVGFKLNEETISRHVRLIT